MAANNPDPFDLVKESVQSSLERTQAMLDRWQLSVSNSAPEEANATLVKELQQNIENIEADIFDLKDTIFVVEENRSKFRNLSDAELRARKSFVANTETKLNSMRKTIENYQQRQQQKQNMSQQSKQSQRARLFDGGTHGRSTFSKLQDDMVRDNDDFIGSQIQSQKTVVEQQDKSLDVLSDSVQRTRLYAERINVELDEHNQMLEEVDEEVDTTSRFVKFTQHKMNGLIKAAGGKGTIILILILVACIIVLIVLLFFVF